MFKIVTHNGVFHADEVTAIAALTVLYHDLKLSVVRSRDMDVIKGGDIVIDVGGVYDPSTFRFDHHQKGAVVIDGRNYSSAGLVWLFAKDRSRSIKTFLNPIIGEDLAYDWEKVWAKVDKFIQAVDWVDTGDAHRCEEELRGAGINTGPAHSYSQVISDFNPPAEMISQATAEEDYMESFMVALEFAIANLKRILVKAVYASVSESKVLELAGITKNGVMVLDKFIPWMGVLNYKEHGHIERVVFQDISGQWRVQKTKWGKNLPAEWAGLQGEDFAKVSGFEDGVFCHNALFICGFHTKQAALIVANTY